MSFTGTARRPEPVAGWFCGPYLTATFLAPVDPHAPASPPALLVRRRLRT